MIRSGKNLNSTRREYYDRSTLSWRATATHAIFLWESSGCAAPETVSSRRFAPPSAQQRHAEFCQSRCNNLKENGWFRIISAYFLSVLGWASRKGRSQVRGISKSNRDDRLAAAVRVRVSAESRELYPNYGRLCCISPWVGSSKLGLTSC